MYPYQLSQALADQHILDLIASAERRAVPIWAAPGSGGHTQSSHRFRNLTSRLGAVLHARRSTMTRTSTAGPMGCSA